MRLEQVQRLCAGHGVGGQDDPDMGASIMFSHEETQQTLQGYLDDVHPRRERAR